MNRIDKKKINGIGYVVDRDGSRHSISLHIMGMDGRGKGDLEYDYYDYNNLAFDFKDCLPCHPSGRVPRSKYISIMAIMPFGVIIDKVHI